MEYELAIAGEQGENEDLYQIALLIDQLKHDDTQLRINASKNILKIGRALGPERTRDELIPFLKESIDDEDEVLLVIAEKLGYFVEILGEIYAYHILEPLELLATVEESAVREAAVKSVETVVNKMSDEHVEEFFVPFLLRLSSKDWFTSRVSAASLLHISYNRVSESIKLEFRKLFIKLCSDETPMVRRMAAIHLNKLIVMITPTEVLCDLLPAFLLLTNDDQDSVRIQMIPNCVSFANVLHQETRIDKILPVVLDIANDRSWRVRWSLALKFPEICRSFGDEITNNTLSTSFESLLGDLEAEVRSAAASNLPSVCVLLNKSVVIAKVMPVAQRLVIDSSEHVRESFAAVVNELAIVLGREDTIEYLLPILLTLLRDETASVRLNIMSNLDVLNRVIGVELLSQSLLPAIVDLAEDAKWRVRLAVIGHIPKLAEHLGGPFFSEKLNALCLTWLGDDVYAVRRAAADNLKMLSVHFGEAWSCQQLVPRLERMHTHTNYLQRMTALYGVQVLTDTLSKEALESVILPFVINMTSDAVPNVRFTVARTLQLVAKVVCVGENNNKTYDNEIMSTLAKLTSDTDRDVRYFAEKATREIYNLQARVK